MHLVGYSRSGLVWRWSTWSPVEITDIVQLTCRGYPDLESGLRVLIDLGFDWVKVSGWPWNMHPGFSNMEIGTL